MQLQTQRGYTERPANTRGNGIRDRHTSSLPYLIGLVKGGIGGPLAGAIILPLLTQHMSVAGAVGIAMPLLIVGDIFAMRFYWREWDPRFMRLLLPGALLGIIGGTFLLVTLPDMVLTVHSGRRHAGYRALQDRQRLVEQGRIPAT